MNTNQVEGDLGEIRTSCDRRGVCKPSVEALAVSEGLLGADT